MLRNIDLKEISDGRLYTANDMVKTDCRGCVNCNACCKGMGETVVLDPFDIYQLNKGTGKDFAALLNDKIQLNVVDGITLPNLIMQEVCGFLDQEGRCSIHQFRPGICRLFPLGRFYENNGFKYFIQKYECPVENKGKIKVKKWLGIADIDDYEEYIWQWHCFLKKCRLSLTELDEEQTRVLNLLILRTFYQDSYKEDFYEDFYEKLTKIKNMLGIN